MSQAHPQGACSCQHVNGYLAREAEGGGIPAILYGAGKTLERDYTHPPKWGSEDDALVDVLARAGALRVRLRHVGAEVVYFGEEGAALGLTLGEW
jgi:hypothetical protein